LGTAEVGVMELTAAYAPFANGGSSVMPYMIARIRSPDGDVYYQHEDSGARVISAPNLAIMNRLMEGVVLDGTGRAARLKDRACAGKTGTTQSYRDAWFMGFTADYVTGVWVGNDDDEPMKKVTGGGLPASIWHEFMTAAHRGLPPRAIPLTPRFPDEEETPLTAERGSEPDISAAQELERELSDEGPTAAAPAKMQAPPDSMESLIQRVSREGDRPAQH
jgi:penicillin-binding protein 1A